MPLPTLDISTNNKLEMLTIEGGDNFRELISGENTVLWHLNIENKAMEQLVVNHFPNLKELLLSYSSISEIDISNLKFLEYLDLSDNKLEGLDLSNNTGLRELLLGSNNLMQLDVSANLDLQYLNATGNPDLTCIQIAEVHQSRLTNENGYGAWIKDETASFSLNCD